MLPVRLRQRRICRGNSPSAGWSPVRSTPANCTTPSATARTGSPTVASMSRPRCARAPSSRSAPEAAGPEPRPAFERRHDRQPQRRAPARRAARSSYASSSRRRAVSVRSSAVVPQTLVAPEEVRQRRPVRRAAERPIDRRVVGLPHLQERDPDAQVVRRIEQRLAIELRARERQRRARREHRRLDLEQADRRPRPSTTAGTGWSGRRARRSGTDRRPSRRSPRGRDARPPAARRSAPPRRRSSRRRRRTARRRADRRAWPARRASRTDPGARGCPRLSGPVPRRWRCPARGISSDVCAASAGSAPRKISCDQDQGKRDGAESHVLSVSYRLDPSKFE